MGRWVAPIADCPWSDNPWYRIIFQNICCEEDKTMSRLTPNTQAIAIERGFGSALLRLQSMNKPTQSSKG